MADRAKKQMLYALVEALRAARPLKKLMRDTFKRIGDAPYVRAELER